MLSAKSEEQAGIILSIMLKKKHLGEINQYWIDVALNDLQIKKVFDYLSSSYKKTNKNLFERVTGKKHKSYRYAVSYNKTKTDKENGAALRIENEQLENDTRRELKMLEKALGKYKN
jgi:hypothetical protein